MYRVSPLTYWVGGMANALLFGRPIQCASDEISMFNPPSGETCGSYMAPYLSQAPGTLSNPGATSGCEYCSLSSANQFLASVEIYWPDRWRDFGLMWVYVGFNVFGAVFLFWYFRVRKASAKESVGVKGKLGAVVEAVRNSYKAKARANKRNAVVF